MNSQSISLSFPVLCLTRARSSIFPRSFHRPSQSISAPWFRGSHLPPWFSSETPSLLPWSPPPSLASPHKWAALSRAPSAAQSPPEGWSPPLDHWPRVKIPESSTLHLSFPTFTSDWQNLQKTLLCTQLSRHLHHLHNKHMSDCFCEASAAHQGLLHKESVPQASHQGCQQAASLQAESRKWHCVPSPHSD